MAVIVTAEQPTSVLFDAGAIRLLAERVLERLSMGALDLRILVVAGPMGVLEGHDGEPLVVRADRSAFEDAMRPPRLSEMTTITSLGRVLLRLRDRRSGAFSDAPADSQLTLSEAAAWDAYSVGRLSRLGYPVHQPRWIYRFRNGHGFTERADASFARLWAGEELTWAEVAALSRDALAPVATAEAAILTHVRTVPTMGSPPPHPARTSPRRRSRNRRSGPVPTRRSADS